MEENKIYEEISEAGIGVIKISDEVVSVIASLAASEIEGIEGMSTKGDISQMFAVKKNMSKGVKVALEGNNAIIDLHVIVQYGVKIDEVSLKVQENVKRTVETMTGLSVAAVNILVQNVILPKSDKEEAKEN